MTDKKDLEVWEDYAERMVNEVASRLTDVFIEASAGDFDDAFALLSDIANALDDVGAEIEELRLQSFEEPADGAGNVSN